MIGRKTGQNDPDATQEYAIPSCSACLRIAYKRGIAIGHKFTNGPDEGRVESVTHAGGEPALMIGMLQGMAKGTLISMALSTFLKARH